MIENSTTSLFTDKWGKPAATHTVEFFHRRVQEIVNQRLSESGKTWEEAVADPSIEFTHEDFAGIEAELLATGYRFEMSAQVSAKEEPEKYKMPESVKDSGVQETDAHGRKVVGTGDNVFQAKQDVTGTARYISTVETVMDMLVNGVPESTIAVIDDSGGTLTAPILESFAGVVCLGGTVRSHLGILTREYNVPCLMAAELDGLSDGDTVHVEFGSAATDPYAEPGTSERARLWKLPESNQR